MSGTIYDTDSKAVTAAQQAINAAGYKPPLTVTGVYDAPTQAGAAWLWTQGSTGAYSGHIDDDFLNAVGIDPAKGGYAGTAAHSDQKAPPPPPGGSTSTRNILLAAAGTGALIGGGFGGIPGAVVGALAGALGGLFAVKSIVSASPPPPPAG